MSDLVEQIEALSREQVFEAVGFLGDSLAVNTDQTSQEASVLAPFTEQPYQNIEEMEQLARITLVAAALNPEYESAVRSAIEGSGKKQFVLGGAEIIALSVIALGALHVIVTKGKTSEKKVITFKETDGKIEMKIEEQVSYGISEKLASIFKAISLP